MTTLTGTSGNDTLKGSTGDDILDGGDGDDVLTGDTGDDELYGGFGNDSLYSGPGSDGLYGGSGDDLLDASGGDASTEGVGDYIRPGTGRNTILGNAALFAANEGIDISYWDVSGSGGIVVMVGSNGTGTVTGAITGVVSDTFSYAHYFEGTADADSMTGSANSNWEGWTGLAGNDTLNGGLGYDELLYHRDALRSGGQLAVNVNFATGNATDGFGNTDTFSNMEAVRGTAQADTFIGSSSIEFLSYRGMAGNDTITGSSSLDRVDYSRDADEGGVNGITVNLATGTATDGFGNTDTLTAIDFVRATDQADQLTGNAGDNKLEGFAGNDVLEGGNGTDYLWGGAGNDTLSGGEGVDWAYFFDATSGVTASLITGQASGGGGAEVLIGVENLLGTDFDDSLTGDANSNSLDGHAGQDTLVSGPGDDYLQGGQGDDSLDGGDDFDLAYYTEAPSSVTASLMTGLASGGAGNDVFTRIEGLSGSTFNDSLTGDAGANDIFGFDGNDLLSGDAGKDEISGDLGNDTIDGGAGTDFTIFKGNRTSYTVTPTTTGWTVSSAEEGVDNLQNMERLKFGDTHLGLDVSGIGGQAYRIYQAAFNRTPDASGLGYWIGIMDDGAELVTVAAAFVNSSEFQAMYGSNPSNVQIINRFYDNVLHRAADQGGLDYWLAILEGGTSVAQVLASFSESAENQAALIGVIGNGFVYTPVV